MRTGSADSDPYVYQSIELTKKTLDLYFQTVLIHPQRSDERVQTANRMTRYLICVDAYSSLVCLTCSSVVTRGPAVRTIHLENIILFRILYRICQHKFEEVQMFNRTATPRIRVVFCICEAITNSTTTTPGRLSVQGPTEHTAIALNLEVYGHQ